MLTQMSLITARTRMVNGVPTSLADLGYNDVGLDDYCKQERAQPARFPLQAVRALPPSPSQPRALAVLRAPPQGSSAAPTARTRTRTTRPRACPSSTPPSSRICSP
jgi:hypothetical protein